MAKVCLIGVPSNLGGKVPGAENGPSSIRAKGLVERLRKAGLDVADMGDVKPVKMDEPFNPRAKNIRSIMELVARLSDKVYGCLEMGNFPLILGGDCSIFTGTMSAFLRKFGDSSCTVYFDAHGDFNTPDTTPSGNVHGMPLALISGQYSSPEVKFDKTLDPRRIAMIGVREVDAGEKILLKKAKVNQFSMDSIKELGIRKVCEEALAKISGGKRFVHVHVDIDVIDPVYAKGTGTPVNGGLSPGELLSALTQLFKSGLVRSFEIAEANPTADPTGKTSELVVDLITSVLKV